LKKLMKRYFKNRKADFQVVLTQLVNHKIMITNIIISTYMIKNLVKKKSLELEKKYFRILYGSIVHQLKIDRSFNHLCGIYQQLILKKSFLQLKC
jgi:hypothetical protein